ncbi:MAG: hypothetical protein IJF67_13205 [Clostridia bacterium]|nr:hypothetical protein [Clostridia bacterium]
MTEPMGGIRRNSFAEAAKLSRETGEPIYVQNGGADSVVIDASAFERLGARLQQLELENKLRQGFAEIDEGRGTSFRAFWEELDRELKDAGI